MYLCVRESHKGKKSCLRKQRTINEEIKKYIQWNACCMPLSDTLGTGNHITIWCMCHFKSDSWIVEVASVSYDVSTFIE